MVRLHSRASPPSLAPNSPHLHDATFYINHFATRIGTADGGVPNTRQMHRRIKREEKGKGRAVDEGMGARKESLDSRTGFARRRRTHVDVVRRQATPRDPNSTAEPSSALSTRPIPPFSTSTPTPRQSTATTSSLPSTSSESSTVQPDTRTTSTRSAPSTDLPASTDSSPSPVASPSTRPRPSTSSTPSSPTPQSPGTVESPSASTLDQTSSSPAPTRTAPAITDNFTTTNIPSFAPMTAESPFPAGGSPASDFVAQPTPAPSPSSFAQDDQAAGVFSSSSVRARIADSPPEEGSSNSVPTTTASSNGDATPSNTANVISTSATATTALLPSPTTTAAPISNPNSLAAFPTSSSPALTISADNSNSSPPSGSENLAIKVVPAVIGSLLVLLLIFFGIAGFCRRRRQRSLEGKAGYRNSRTSSFGGVEASNSGEIMGSIGRSEMTERRGDGNGVRIVSGGIYQERAFDDEQREKSPWKRGSLLGKAVAIVGGGIRQAKNENPKPQKDPNFSTSSFGDGSDNNLAEEDRPRRRDGPINVNTRSVALMMGEEREGESGSTSSVASSMDRGVGGYNSQSRHAAPARLPTISFNAHGSPSSHAIHDSFDSNDPFSGPDAILIPTATHRRGSFDMSAQTLGGESESHSTEGTSSFELHSARRATLGTPTNDGASLYADEDINNTVRPSKKFNMSPKKRKDSSLPSRKSRPSISAPFNVNPGRFPENVESDPVMSTPKAIGGKLDGSWW